VAYAIYRFDLTARTGRLGINTEWAQALGNYKLLWLGASNWQKDRWDWRCGAPAGVVDAGTDCMALYKHPQTGELYVAVVLLGQSAGALRKIWLTCSLRGDWWMYGRNATHHASSPFKGPDYPTVMWQAVIAKSPIPTIQGSPVYDVNGILYVRGNRVPSGLFAVNADGSIKWLRDLAPTSTPGGDGQEQPASPVVDDDGTIYAACGVSGVPLYAFTQAGEVKWNFSGHGAIMAQPAIVPAGTILVTGFDNNSPIRYYIHAVNREGAQLWEYCFGDAMCSPPAVAADGTAYICYGDQLSAFDTAGVVKWSYQAGADLNSRFPPVVGPAGRIYIVSYEQELYAVDSGGTLAWSVPLAGDWAGSLALGADGTICIGCGDERIYSYDSNGVIRWSYYLGGYCESLSVDASGMVYAPANNCRLFALNADGTLKWWWVTPFNVASKPVIGEDGAVYVMTDDGTLSAIGPGSVMDEYTASGYVKEEGTGVGLAGVSVNITGEEPVVTDASGFWSKSGLAPGTYLASPNKAGLRFTPGLSMFSVEAGDVAIEDFSGVALTPAVWQMYGMNGGHTRCSPHTGPAAPNVAWSTWLEGYPFREEFAIGGDGVVYSQSGNAFNFDGTERWGYPAGARAPALSAVDGTVYISSGEALLALTPAGVLKWSMGGLSLVPTIAPDDSLVLGKDSVIVLDLAGYTRWRRSGLGVDYRTSPAVGADGAIYAIRLPHEVCALNPDGTERWATVVDTGGATERGFLWTAVADDGAVYASIGTRIFALNADGLARWSYAVAGEELLPPAIGVDGALYTAIVDTRVPANKKVIALNPDGTLRWEYSTDGYGVSSPLTVDVQSTVYVSINGLGDLYALNPDGTVKWTFGCQANLTPVSIGADGTLYFGDEVGHVFALGPGAG
jgi:hypothetical protein